MSGAARLAGACLAAVLWASALPAAQPAPTSRPAPASRPSATSRPALPQTPGFHNLYYTGPLNGKDRKLAYILYLPKGYDPNRSWPMVVYLCGVGERGDNHEGVYGNGPPLSLKADKALADWAPFIILAPQCPPDLRWDSPGVPKLVSDLTGLAKEGLAVDGDRVYLTGLSMGGAGVWNVALEAKGTFAVIAPFCAIEVAADKMAEAVRGATVWIICGGADGGYTEGSRKMYKVLREGKIDVVYTEVPGQAHGVWPPFYASRQFYEFLLMHRRGQKSPTSRPVQEQLLAISYTPPNSADAQLAGPFQKFLPWWYLDNCGRDNSLGLKAELLGRKNVFVTMPLDKAVPCRLLYTTTIPQEGKTTLALAVAAHPQGQWELVVRADGNDLLRRTIGELRAATKPSTQPSTHPSSQPASAPSPWVEVSVDLSPLAGQDVHLELANRSAASSHPEAYWGKVELATRVPPAAPVEAVPAAPLPARAEAPQPEDSLRQIAAPLLASGLLLLYGLNWLSRWTFGRRGGAGSLP